MRVNNAFMAQTVLWSPVVKDKNPFDLLLLIRCY